MAGEKITKIYDLQELGGEHVIAVLEQINQEFAAIKRSKQALNKESLKASFDGDTEAVNKLKLQFEELRLKELKLRNDRQALINQGKQAQLARQQEIADQKRAAAGNQALAGSYNDLSKKLRDLQRDVKNNFSLGDTSIELKQKLEAMKALKKQLDDYNRNLSPDGTLIGEYKTGILNAFKDAGLTDLIQNQLTQAKTKSRDLNVEFEKLQAELRRIQSTGQGSFETLERQLLENRTAAGQLNSQITNLENGIRGTGVGTQIVDGIKASFKDLGKQIAQVAIGYIGFQAAISGVQKAIQNNYDLSDKYVDLQRVLSATDDEFKAISESIREIDTRTSINKLFDFAFIAAKAGVAKIEIAGVTEALDQLYIVAGKSLGDPEKTFESLVKLNTIFNNGAPVTAENLQKLGNAIIQLDNAGVASGGYIVDFAQRLAGIEGITKIAIQSVLGLAAAFEENGASAEVAATATSQVLMKLYSDTEKYSGIAGITKKAFEDLLNSNPGEALLKVSEGLKGNAKSATEFAENFADLEAKGVRVQAVIGTLADKSEYFRKKILLANNALQDNSAIQEGAAKKQQNFAANVDKIRKSFELLSTSETALSLMKNVTIAIQVLIVLLPFIIKLFTLWATGWVILNTQMLIARARVIGYTIALALLNKAQTLVNLATFAYNAALGATTGLTTAATAATRLWSAAITVMPIGWIIVLLGALVAVLVSVGSAFAGTTDSIRKNTLAYQLNNKIAEEVNQQTSSTIAKLNALTAAVKDNTLSQGARKKALEDLIAISPEYLSKLTLENIATAEGTKIITDYVNALKLKAQAQAIDTGLTEAQKRKDQAEMEEYKVGSDPSYAKQKYRELAGNSPFFKSLIDAAKYGTLNSEQAFLKDYYQQQEKAAQEEIDFFTGKVKKNLQDSVKDISNSTDGVIVNTIGARKKALEDQIKLLDEAYYKLDESNKEGQETNRKQKIAAQKELDEIDAKNNGKPKNEKSYGGAKLTGETKDDLKNIEAETSLLLVELEKRKTLATISESEYYLELNKITQDGITKKLSVIKDGNAEEKKQRAALELDSIKSTQELNDRLYELGEKAAKQNLETLRSLAENKLKLVTENENSTELQKAEAQLQYDKESLQAQIWFNETMDFYEKEYGIKSLENAKKRNNDLWEEERKAETQRIAVTRAAAVEREKVINDTYSIQSDNEDADYLNKQKKIFDTTFLTKQQQNNALEKLETEHHARMLGNQAAYLKTMQNNIVQQGLSGTITWEEYQKRLAEINKLIAQNQADTAEQTSVSIDKTREATIKTIEAITQALQRVASVFGAYADMQSQKIQNENDAKDAQIDADKEKALSTAHTEQEKQAVEDKYAKIKTVNDKKYAEQRRSIALRELEIQSALAALVAYTDGLKAGGPAGPWVGAGYVALVGAIYLLNRQRIMSQKFEDGGSLKKVLNGGGFFDGPSHKNGGIPFSFAGQPKEVEGKEGYVINKNSMASGKRMTVTGTPAQISSAANVVGGGIDFAPGASRFMYEYGGSLGMNLNAPVIAPRQYINSSTSQGNIEVLETMKAQADAIAALSSQILTLQVGLNPNLITNYQKNKQKAVNLSRL